MYKSWCLITLIFLFCTMQMGSSATYFGAGFVVIAAIWALVADRNLRDSLLDLYRKEKRIWIALGLFVVIACVVMAFQRVSSVRSWGELKWAFFFLGFVVAAMTFLSDSGVWRDRKTRWMVFFFLGMTLFSAFAAFYQFVTGDDPFRKALFGKTGWGHRGHGLLRNPVPFGKLIGSLGLIALASFLSFLVLKNRRWSWICLAVTIACGIAVISSQSRGTWLALVFVAALGWLVVPRGLTKVWFIGVGSAVILGLAAILLHPDLSKRAQTIFTDTVHGSNRIRVEQWHVNWHILKDNPFGVGFDGNDLRQAEVYKKLGYELPLARGHCHNEFIEIAVATGWPGFACYLFVTVGMLYIPIRALRRLDFSNHWQLGLLLIASFFVQVFLNMAAMTDAMDTQSRLIMSAAWAVGIAGGYWATREPGNPQV